MRVIGGEFRSRRLTTPRGLATRPSSDRLRETLFNVLGPRVQGARFADLYAGSGAVGMEALSRGAAFCCFAERVPAALAAIRANLSSLGLRDRVQIEPCAVARALHNLVASATPDTAFNIVFLDPPYEAAGDYAETLNTLGAHAEKLLTPDAIVVAEHARRSSLRDTFGLLKRYRLLEQGDAALSFYAPTAQSA